MARRDKGMEVEIAEMKTVGMKMAERIAIEVSIIQVST